MTNPVAPYYVQIIKRICIVNPVQRTVLPVGDIVVDYDYVVKALTTAGMSIHNLDPLELIDKIGFLKQGDDAAEMLLEALDEQAEIDIAAGGQFMNLQGDPTPTTDT